MARFRNLLAVLVLLLVIFSVGQGWPGEAHAQGCTKLTNNMVIQHHTTFCVKSYSFNDTENDGVIIIGAHNIIVNGNGLTLDGRNKSGYGISLNGYTGVTIVNFNIKGYHYAIKVENADGVRVERNHVWSNEGKDVSFYDINIPLPWTYGGGILVNRTTNSTFESNTGSGQNVGINLYHSSGNRITRNDFSDNFAWGIRLYASTFNTISSNRADRVHGCWGRFCTTRDTAGILLVHGSHANTISGNSITHGGDGFFIGNEWGLPSNYNSIENNDARFAFHNAIETTFSEGNVFRGNNASNSDYGFWLGFSHHSIVENNTINHNRTDGIHWEHGRFGTIKDNRIIGNGRFGLALTLNPDNWWLMERYPGSEAAHHYAISGNTLAANCQWGIYLRHVSDSSIRSNTIAGNTVNLYFDGDSTNNTAAQNNILCKAVGSTCQHSASNNMFVGQDVNAEYNWWGTNDGGLIAALVFDSRNDPTRGTIDYDPWLASPLSLSDRTFPDTSSDEGAGACQAALATKKRAD